MRKHTRRTKIFTGHHPPRHRLWRRLWLRLGLRLRGRSPMAEPASPTGSGPATDQLDAVCAEFAERGVVVGVERRDAVDAGR